MSNIFHGLPLATLAGQIASAAQAFEAQPTMAELRPVQQAIEAVSDPDLFPDRLVRSLSNIRLDHQTKTKQLSILEDLNYLEGTLYGHMANRELFPAEHLDRVLGRLDDLSWNSGNSQALIDGANEAHRQIRRGFVSGFVDAAGIEPVRGRRYLKPTHMRPFSRLQGHWAQPSFLKPETEQEGGSYVIRGVLFYLLQILQTGVSPKERTIACAPPSGLIEGFIRSAYLLGFPNVTVYVPMSPHTSVLRRIRELGATPKTLRVVRDDVEAAAQRELAKERRAIFVPNQHPLLAMGYGTIGLEIMRSLGAAAVTGYSVIVPSRDVSLLRGVATLLGQKDAPTYALDLSDEDFGVRRLTGRNIHRGAPLVAVLPDQRMEERDLAAGILDGLQA